MIGTGGISASHLDAYRTAGWEVAALWNRTRSKAEEKAAEYCPDARIEDDWQAILANAEIDVVDVTLHPEHRAPIIEAALEGGQACAQSKAFRHRSRCGRRPRKTGAGQEREAGRQPERSLGAAQGVHARSGARRADRRCAVGPYRHPLEPWLDAGHALRRIEDLVLYDFGVHWFDFIASLVGARAQSVFATTSHARGQANKVPLMAQALVRLDGGQASLVFDGGIPHGPRDTSYVGRHTGKPAIGRTRPWSANGHNDHARWHRPPSIGGPMVQ
jgi:predicted dehydrogenase